MAKRFKLINKPGNNRHIIDYQIVSYMPSSTKAERLNIGVIVYDYTNQEVKINLISKDSPKLTFLTKLDKEIYQNNLQYLLEVLRDCIVKNDFDYLLSQLPDQLSIKNTYSARSDNSDKLLQQLFEVYCDGRFWDTSNTKKFIINPN